MSLKSRFRITSSVAFRLTLMYAFLCAISLLAILGIAYLALHSTLQARLDEGLAQEIEEYGSLLETQNLEVLRDVLAKEAASEGTGSVFFRVLDKKGEVLVSTDMSAWAGVPLDHPHLLAASKGMVLFETRRHPSRPAPDRIAYGSVGPGLIMQLGESTAVNAEILEHFRQIFALGILAVLGCSMPIGAAMAHRALSGVRRVTQAVRRLSSGGWDSRVSVSRRHDEIDELASSFNEMGARIQTLIRELREVTDDIAHDLRTPITRMRMAAEAALSNASTMIGSEEVSGHVVEECDHLLDLINTMLEISQTEAGARPLAQERTDTWALVEDVCQLFQTAAEDKGVCLSFCGPKGLLVDGEPKRLKRAIAHILDNAIKFTPCGGTISVECFREEHEAKILICDTGVGVPEKDLERIFARFYRVEKSRSEGGNGLGLSLSRAILRAHGGDVSATSVSGEGSTFSITLPLIQRRPPS